MHHTVHLPSAGIVLRLVMSAARLSTTTPEFAVAICSTEGPSDSERLAHDLGAERESLFLCDSSRVVTLPTLWNNLDQAYLDL
jgi:hypothetical protein